MRLLQCRLDNFRAHRETEIVFPKTGIIGLVGDNESGKSSVLESLTWALYGAKGIRGKASDLRWRGAPARKIAKAVWTIEVDGDVYEVTRSEGKCEVIMWPQDGSEGRTVASTASGVTEFMTKVIGMTLDEFKASYLCSQKDVARITTMTPETRRKFVRGVMGADILDGATADARANARKLRVELNGFRQGMPDEERTKDAYNHTRAAYRHWRDEAQRRDEAHTAQHQELLAIEERLAEVEALRDEHEQLVAEVNRLEALSNRRRETTQRLVQDRSDQRAAQREIESLNRELEGYSEASETEVNQENLLRIRNRAEAKADLLSGYRADLRDVVKEIDEVQPVIDVYRRHHRETHGLLRERVAKVRTEYEETKKQRVQSASYISGRIVALTERLEDLDTSIGDGNCPMCGRKWKDLAKLQTQRADTARELDRLTEDHKALDEPGEAESALANRLTNLTDDLVRTDMQERASKDAERRRAELVTRRASLRNSITKIEEELETLMHVGEYDSKVHERARRRVRYLDQLQGRLGPLQKQAAKLSATESELGKARADLLEADNAMLQANEKALTHPWAAQDLAGEHLALTNSKHAFEAAVEKSRAAVVEAQLKEATSKASVRAATDRLKEWREAKAKERELASALAVEETVAQRLTQFRIEVLSTVRPELEELLSGLIDLLSDGRHETSTLDDSFGVTLHEGGVPSPVISGGTEDIAALGLRIALSQLIAERSGTPLSLLILDEPLGGLDKTRRSNVLALLRRLQGHFPQVILISHVAETREAVDHAIEFQFNEQAGHTVAFST